MRILIDADSCPVVGITINLAKQHDVECIILCDTSHIFERQGARTITVSKGNDSVDFKLVNMIQNGDIVVTQDYGLAAMCLAKNATVISQNGIEYTNSNIESLLYSRFVSKKIRNAGGRLKGPSKRSAEEDKKFENLLKNIIERKG